MGSWRWKLHLRDVLWFLTAQCLVSKAIEFVGVFPDFRVERDLGGWYAETRSFGKGKTIGKSEVGAHHTVDGCCFSISIMNSQIDSGLAYLSWQG